MRDVPDIKLHEGADVAGHLCQPCVTGLLCWSCCRFGPTENPSKQASKVLRSPVSRRAPPQRTSPAPLPRQRCGRSAPPAPSPAQRRGALITLLKTSAPHCITADRHLKQRMHDHSMEQGRGPHAAALPPSISMAGLKPQKGRAPRRPGTRTARRRRRRRAGPWRGPRARAAG